MPAKIYTGTLYGLSGHLVEVEADSYGGLPQFFIVGLTDIAIQEAKKRVRSAIINSHYPFPPQKAVVNLAPADVHKRGPALDLPIALAVILERKCINVTDSETFFIIGELSLDGRVREVSGVLPLLQFAREQGFTKCIIPFENLKEAQFFPEMEVHGVQSLKDAVMVLLGNHPPSDIPRQDPSEISDIPSTYDMKHIFGQSIAKRSMTIAAAGGHNMLMVGPPGSGKTLLAKTFSTILPPMTLNEALEVTKIYSVAGLLMKNQALVMRRPFRTVHHTASDVSVIGGGKIPMPGEISLAHKGVLFLDELSEFPTTLLEALRQPLEDKTIAISRVHGSVSYPADFQLIGATNPCPCGFFGDEAKKCTCPPKLIERYQKKLSGPFLDRIDLCIDVRRIPLEEFRKHASEQETSRTIRDRVVHARKLQQQRYKGQLMSSNSQLLPAHMEQYCALHEPDAVLFQDACKKLHLSGRVYHRLLKVARTIADLEGAESIARPHLLEALQYRGKLHMQEWNRGGKI